MLDRPLSTRDQKEFPKTIVAGETRLTVDKSGRVTTSGPYGSFDNLGRRTPKNHVKYDSFGVEDFGNGRVVDIFYFYTKTFFLTEAGQLWACGSNSCGELGVGVAQWKSPIRRVQLPKGAVVVDIAVDVDQLYIKTASGNIYAAGKNTCDLIGGGDTSVLGIGSNEKIILNPTLIQLPPEAVLSDIKLSNMQPPDHRGSHAGQIRTADGFYVYGPNGYHQLGLNHNKPVLKPTKVTSVDNIRYFYTRNGDSYIFTETGQIYLCGRNYGDTPELIETYMKSMPYVYEIPIPLLVQDSSGDVYIYKSGYPFDHEAHSVSRVKLDIPNNDRITGMELVDSNWILTGMEYDYCCSLKHSFLRVDPIHKTNFHTHPAEIKPKAILASLDDLKETEQDHTDCDVTREGTRKRVQFSDYGQAGPSKRPVQGHQAKSHCSTSCKK